MYLEHINLTVSNIDEALTFYRAAFPDWVIRGEGEQVWFGKPRRWLHFGNEHYYIVLCDNGEGSNRDLTGHQVGLAHFAFVVSNIKAMQTRLLEAGFVPDKDGADEPYRTNLYYIDPAGFEVEFVEYHSDLMAERNTYAA
ncbi:VOC family protein [Alteromonas sp. 5E99-2]|uniref:VOC family protein n=1 Tax=Alteromonas sp. 5E99-2 TaxID=2817683 RepID=UPI001A998706|nr:VOC family protein [Alteromonas sp. 5E99-2]MBO1256384.1 VOC family protein [Alteromonas sp. 5E99-2]